MPEYYVNADALEDKIAELEAAGEVVELVEGVGKMRIVTRQPIEQRRPEQRETRPAE